jgi:hypothetical protein
VSSPAAVGLTGDVDQVEDEHLRAAGVDLTAGVGELAGAAGDSDHRDPIGERAGGLDRPSTVEEEGGLALERAEVDGADQPVTSDLLSARVEEALGEDDVVAVALLAVVVGVDELRLAGGRV